MQKDINLPIAAVINDIDALIAEIDQNPQISSWVIRLVLRSIKEKARKMVLENPQKITRFEQTLHFNGLSDTSKITTKKIRSLR